MRCAILFLLLGLHANTLRAQVAADVANDTDLEVFLAWEQKQMEHSAWDQREQLTRYRAKLETQGLNATEAAAKIAALDKRLWADEAEFWSKIYSDAAPSFNTKPNQLLADAIKVLRPGKALDVEMGQGRNAILLAQQGWEVTGFDISEKALALAQQQAQSTGVKINTVLSRDEEFDFGKQPWDLIAMIYPMEKRSFARAREALKPGGVIVIEGFHRDVTGPTVRYASNELLDRFAGFKILFYQEAVDAADWGSRRCRLVKLIAQKPD